jgi:RNA polymerase sigma-70 factor (ECF subfamily)
MGTTLSNTGGEVAEIYARHVSTIYRICFAYMKNGAESEDIVQDTFVRLMRAEMSFESAEHEKAWLIRTAVNLCKDHLRHWWRKREDIEKCGDLRGENGIEVDLVLDAVLSLPDKYKAVVYLYYYEGYSGAEIAQMLQKPHSTIRNWLREARKILRIQLGGDFEYEE